MTAIPPNNVDRLLYELDKDYERQTAEIRARERFRWLLIILAAVACLLAPLAAQTVHIANYSGSEFHGWKRCTVDILPPHQSGQLAAPDGLPVRYVLGRKIGTCTWVLDVDVHLLPGQVFALDLAESAAAPFALQSPPDDALAFFGAPSIAGAPLQVVDLQPDGAAWLAHLRARTGAMLCTDLWVTWYPDRPGWACGEVVVTASNPTVPAVTTVVPSNFLLRFGAADVLIPGLPTPTASAAQAGGACLLPAGASLGDGQARSFPLVLVWRQHLATQVEWSSAGAAAALAICANGISKLLPDGNPSVPARFSPLAWTREHWAGAIERLHTWDAGPLGVVAGSTQTGAQEDQVFVGGECMLGPVSLGSETVRYLVALGQSRRPCHHLEASGTQINPGLHPQLVLWSSRPHWHRGVSPDQLGKSRSVSDLDTHGWIGPDREHLLINTLSASARLTGSPALQWQLSAQARNFLLSETIDPRLSTSGPDAARSVGWAGIAVAHLWTTLEDRVLAEQVAARWRQRVLQVYVPQLGTRVADVWDPRTGDQRLIVETGSDPNWMPEQQAVGAYGMDLACSLVGPVEGRALALRGAKAVLDRAFVRQGNRWVEWERLAFQGTDMVVPVEGRTAHRTGWYTAAWFPLATATVLRHEPGNERAVSIWAQQWADSGNGGAWMPPGVQR